MAKVKTVTVRLAQSTYEKLCQLADSLEELPSEMARDILREFLAEPIKDVSLTKAEGKGVNLITNPRLKEVLDRVRAI